MRGRFRFLIACLAVVLVPRAAWAHRLVVDCRVLPDHKVQVEGWFNSAGNPHPAVHARVDVLRADGSQLAEGQLDANGVYVFSYERAEDLKIVVSQTGHREEALLAATSLGAPGSAPPPGAGSTSPARRESLRDWIREVLIGVGFVLALAAFVLSVRNARELRRRRDRQD